MGWRDPEFRKAERARRRAARICLQCQAGLQDTDRDYCVECVEMRADASAKYADAHPDRPRGTYNPVKVSVRRTAEYQRKKVTETCVHTSCKEPPYGSYDRCRPHLMMQRKSSRDYARRKALRPVTAVFRAIAEVAREITRRTDSEAHPRQPDLSTSADPSIPPAGSARGSGS